MTQLDSVLDTGTTGSANAKAEHSIDEVVNATRNAEITLNRIQLHRSLVVIDVQLGRL